MKNIRRERALRPLRVSHLRLALPTLRRAVLVAMASRKEAKLRDDGVLRALRGHVRADVDEIHIQNAVGSSGIKLTMMPSFRKAVPGTWPGT